MVASTGESMEAFNWNATAAVMSTVISRPIPPGRESTGSGEVAAAVAVAGDAAAEFGLLEFMGGSDSASIENQLEFQ